MKNPLQNRKRICRLCLIKCDIFETIDGNIKDGLNSLLPKIDLFVSEEPIVCAICAEIVKACFDVKAKWLDTYDFIVSFAKDKSYGKIDIKKVYLSKKENVTPIPEDQNVCGLCMGLVQNSSALSLYTEGDDMLQKTMLEICFPELDLSIIEKPIICAACHESLKECYRFVTNYSTVEEKITKYCNSLNIIDEKCAIDLNNVLQFTLNIVDDEKVADTVNIVKQEKICFDTEYVDELVEEKNDNFVKMEYPQEFESVLFTIKNELTCEEEDKKDGIIKGEEQFDVEQVNEIPLNENAVKTEDQKFLHDVDIEMKTDEQDFNRSQDDAEPRGNPTTTPEKKSTLESHNSKETKMHECETCSYKTKFKSNLSKHMLVHAASSQLTKYRCKSCVFRTKHKSRFTKHVQAHQNGVEIKTYRCDSCLFQTRYKGSLTKHMLVHRDPSEITMFRCGLCAFQAKRKYELDAHSLSHEDSSEVPSLQCEFCSFRTKSKRYLNNHLTTHNDASAPKMHRCEVCTFQTRYRQSLKRHLVKHKDSSEVVIYECASCSYRTRYKDVLDRHSFIHRDSSETTMYKCNSCPYQTMIKKSLRSHGLVHKSSTEVSMHRCGFCDFETKYYRCHQRHVWLMHRKLSK